jgi:hypothetical protein
MEISFVGVGPRYNGDNNAVGAQTERSGVARPVRTMLGGENSPATFFVHLLRVRSTLLATQLIVSVSTDEVLVRKLPSPL